jgi:hypothetical protein
LRKDSATRCRFDYELLAIQAKEPILLSLRGEVEFRSFMAGQAGKILARQIDVAA